MPISHLDTQRFQTSQKVVGTVDVIRLGRMDGEEAGTQGRDILLQMELLIEKETDDQIETGDVLIQSRSAGRVLHRVSKKARKLRLVDGLDRIRVVPQSQLGQVGIAQDFQA